MSIFDLRALEKAREANGKLVSELKEANEEIAELNTSLESAMKEIEGLQNLQAELKRTKEALQVRDQALITAKLEVQKAQTSLEQFETSLRASIAELGPVLEIGDDRWIDPTAVWHVFIKPPYTYQERDGETVEVPHHTLFLNNQATITGARPELLVQSQRILKAKGQELN